MKMTPAVTRAARAWLEWTQADLARRAGCALTTVQDYEAGTRRTIPAVVGAIERAFRDAGMTFWVVNSESEPRMAMTGPTI